jgi:pyruvate/2-oxoglutarate dehydrogenase complex dihydrolipoamide dehydrogenase (E3) component
MEAGLSAQAFSEIVQAHPTLSEVIRDAARAACASLAGKN